MNLRDFCKLAAEGLVKIKQYPEKNLAVIKYDRKVFYKNLWHLDPLLLEARGAVFDLTTGEVVIHPFTKVFNYQENGTMLPLDTVVIAPRKVNGFMASVTRYQDEILVATTGSLDSDFVVLAREMLALLDLDYIQQGHTFLFEIVHPKDPHIVEEEPGAYLIGMRRHEVGDMMPEAGLDQIATLLGAKRPAVLFGQFCDVLKMVAECKHEGFMVRLFDTEETVMKIKSPHYLTKKFLMRMGQNKIDFMFDSTEAFKQNIDEEFYDIVDHIVKEFDAVSWGVQPEQQRRHIVEQYFASK